MRVMPYRMADDVADGVVPMFTDIFERKRTEDHRNLLLAELSPSVKNMLAMVQPIAGQSRKVQDYAALESESSPPRWGRRPSPSPLPAGSLSEEGLLRRRPACARDARRLLLSE
jgi:hypothetical protein